MNRIMLLLILATIMQTGCKDQKELTGLKEKVTNLEKQVESLCNMKPRIGYQVSLKDKAKFKYFKITFYSNKLLCSTNELKGLVSKYIFKEFGTKNVELYIELFDGEKFDMQEL